MEKKSVNLREVVSHVLNVSKQFETTIVEGAGGLLSPLGEKFDSRDCLLSLKATPILVCPNRLGAINQVLLVLNALPKDVVNKLQIVLMSSQRATIASRSNLKLLAEFIEPLRIHVFPWLRQTKTLCLDDGVRKSLDRIFSSSGL